MRQTPSKFLRVLGIAPGTKGFGFALIEGNDKLVDWGVRAITGEKNKQCLSKVREMIAHYQPHVMVLENTWSRNSRRSKRIQALTSGLTALASDSNVEPVLFSRKQVMDAFFSNTRDGTKHALAEKMAEGFPAELGFRLPSKRRAWESEDPRLDMFYAVALALVLWEKSFTRRTA